MKNALPQIFKILAKLCVTIMENAEKESSDSSSELSDDEYAEKLRELNELRAKSEAQESTMKDEEAKDEDSEDEDEVEEAVTDFTLYYSPLDRVHELYYVRTRLEEFGAKDRELYEQLGKALSKDEMEAFRRAMEGAKELQEEVDEEYKS